MFGVMHDGWRGGMHGGWWLVCALVIGLVVWIVFRASDSRSLAASARAAPQHEPPLDILQRRYAEGEISTEEYEERKTRLENEPR